MFQHIFVNSIPQHFHLDSTIAKPYSSLGRYINAQSITIRSYMTIYLPLLEQAVTKSHHD